MEVLAKATMVELRKAGTGNPQVIAEFYIQSGRFKEQTCLWYGSLVGGAIPITTKALRLMGWNGNLKELGTAKKNQVRLMLEVEESENRPRIRVRGVYPKARELTQERFADHEIASLQTLLNEEREEREREPGGDDDEYDPSDADWRG